MKINESGFERVAWITESLYIFRNRTRCCNSLASLEIHNSALPQKSYKATIYPYILLNFMSFQLIHYSQPFKNQDVARYIANHGQPRKKKQEIQLNGQ